MGIFGVGVGDDMGTTAVLEVGLGAKDQTITSPSSVYQRYCSAEKKGIAIHISLRGVQAEKSETEMVEETYQTR